MFHGKKLFLLIILAITLPLFIAFMSKETFRYPCQDPQNWNTPQCTPPACEVTQTCPEHVFSGGNNPQTPQPKFDCSMCNLENKGRKE
jgi:hypothetical protein